MIPIKTRTDDFDATINFAIKNCRVDCKFDGEKRNPKEIKVVLNTGNEILIKDQKQIEDFSSIFMGDEDLLENYDYYYLWYCKWLMGEVLLP